MFSTLCVSRVYVRRYPNQKESISEVAGCAGPPLGWWRGLPGSCRPPGTGSVQSTTSCASCASCARCASCASNYSTSTADVCASPQAALHGPVPARRPLGLPGRPGRHQQGRLPLPPPRHHRRPCHRRHAPRRQGAHREGDQLQHRGRQAEPRHLGAGDLLPAPAREPGGPAPGGRTPRLDRRVPAGLLPGGGRHHRRERDEARPALLVPPG